MAHQGRSTSQEDAPFLFQEPASQILYRLIYDIFFYGAPRDWIDLLWILVYYLGDLLTAFVGFLVTLLLLNRAYLREEKAYLDYSAD